MVIQMVRLVLLYLKGTQNELEAQTCELTY